MKPVERLAFFMKLQITKMNPAVCNKYNSEFNDSILYN